MVDTSQVSEERIPPVPTLSAAGAEVQHSGKVESLEGEETKEDPVGVEKVDLEFQEKLEGSD